METSAKNNFNINDVFRQIIEGTLNYLFLIIIFNICIDFKVNH